MADKPLKFEQLNERQRLGVQIIRSGGNVLFTGPAGTGKSTLLRFLKAENKHMAITASTGIAAIGVEGCTLHSWLGLGLGEAPAAEIAAKHLKRKNGQFYQIVTAKMLAIDEISMIDADLLDKAEEVLRLTRRNSRPFGGLQVVLFGDFLQLPSVSKNGRPARFAFESRAWAKAEVKVVMLTQIMRQKEQAFADILNRVRIGDSSEEVRQVLRPRINAVDPDPSIKAVEICETNETAHRINAESLAAIKEETHTWEASDWAEGDMYRQQLDKNCLAPKTLELKVGAQVMLLKNLDVEAGLANGSLGKVVEVRKAPGEKFPVVQFTNGAKLEIDRAEWKIARGDDVLASRRQIPLRLAYAVTAHKCQGMTLDKIRVHVGRCFAPGQAYVAMSRCKTLEGLFIASISGNSIRADPTALAFYRQHANATPDRFQLVGEHAA